MMKIKKNAHAKVGAILGKLGSFKALDELSSVSLARIIESDGKLCLRQPEELNQRMVRST